MNVLELGNFIVPAYAGMVLAEQDCTVTKWINPDTSDPTLSLTDGEALWDWLNAGKTVRKRPLTTVLELARGSRSSPDIIIDNFRPEMLERCGIDPGRIAKRLGAVWVSMRSEVGGRSFDMLAQMRSLAEYGPYLPYYIGDTAGGLWLAMKALAMYANGQSGHYSIYQASCLQKLVEGELLVEPSVPRNGFATPWDEEDTYFYSEATHTGNVRYKDTIYQEPVRDRAWKLAHLNHHNGRIIV